MYIFYSNAILHAGSSKRARRALVCAALANLRACELHELNMMLEEYYA